MFSQMPKRMPKFGPEVMWSLTLWCCNIVLHLFRFYATNPVWRSTMKRTHYRSGRADTSMMISCYATELGMFSNMMIRLYLACKYPLTTMQEISSICFSTTLHVLVADFLKYSSRYGPFLWFYSDICSRKKYTVRLCNSLATICV